MNNGVNLALFSVNDLALKITITFNAFQENM